MGKIVGIISVLGMLTIMGYAESPKAKADGSSIVVVFKDGHQQTFALADIARIEFSAPTISATSSTANAWPAHFVGKWKVGDGAGGTFTITLMRNGQAKKSLGESHGTWTTMNGEARISWDDGWHDIIRKAGDGYEKAAFGPGKSLDAAPSNVAEAENTEPI